MYCSRCKTSHEKESCPYDQKKEERRQRAIKSEATLSAYITKLSTKLENRGYAIDRQYEFYNYQRDSLFRNEPHIIKIKYNPVNNFQWTDKHEVAIHYELNTISALRDLHGAAKNARKSTSIFHRNERGFYRTLENIANNSGLLFYEL